MPERSAMEGTREAAAPKARWLSDLMVRVARRLRVESGIRRFLPALWAAAGVYALLLILGRVLGLLAVELVPLSVLAVPAVAGGIAVLVSRRSRSAEIARRIDAACGGKDLFLTASMLEGSLGEYQPVVLAQAEVRSTTVRPWAVVPYHFAPAARAAGIATVALLAGVVLLPLMDPFGKAKARARAAERREGIASARKDLQIKIEKVEKGDPKAENSKPIEQALKDLEKQLNEMKPVETKANLAKISMDQKALSELWKRLSEEKLKNMEERGDASSMAQASARRTSRRRPSGRRRWRRAIRSRSRAS